MIKSKLEQKIIDALEPVANEHGLDLVDVEVVGATKAPCVRVRIEPLDLNEEFGLDNVAANNAWISDLLDEVDPFTNSYTLEVSSPGIYRPLRRACDFERFSGEQCEITMNVHEGRRKYTGVIVSVDDGLVVVDCEGEQFSLAVDEMKKAKLKPEISFKAN